MTVLSKLAKFKFKPTLFQFLLGIIFLSLVSGVFVFLFRSQQSVNITIKVNDDSVVWPNEGVTSWFNNFFYPGMEEKDSLGSSIARVVKVTSYDSTPLKKTIYLDLQVKALYSSSDDRYKFKGKDVLVGQIIPFSLNDVWVEGFITDVKDKKKNYPKKKIIIEAKVINQSVISPETEGVKPHVADAIKIGAEIGDGNDTIMKIIDKRVEPAVKTVITERGEVLAQRDPIKVDVYLTIEANVSLIGDRYYIFNDIPVSIDAPIPVHLKNISVWPIVISIKEAK